jgi:hypothetical protein
MMAVVVLAGGGTQCAADPLDLLDDSAPGYRRPIDTAGTAL